MTGKEYATGGKCYDGEGDGGRESTINRKFLRKPNAYAYLYDGPLGCA